LDKTLEKIKLGGERGLILIYLCQSWLIVLFKSY